jgi:hypothetical protein
MRWSLLFLVVLVRAASADCPREQTPASCALHDEGVKLLGENDYEGAALKFRAAIAAGPTARTYLGYAQAVEGQGLVALAYETVLLAEQASREEVASKRKDPSIKARAERIKYKVAELGAKVAFVQLKLPPGVEDARLVSVFREREGDLEAPLARWIAVAPERQLLYATFDDGTRTEVVATVAAGSKTTIVIPREVASTRPTPDVRATPATPDPAPRVLPNLRLAASGGVTLDAGEIGIGMGINLTVEHRLAPRIAAVARIGFVYHAFEEDPAPSFTVTGRELALFAGVRTRAQLPVYVGLEAGLLRYERIESLEDQGDGYTNTTSHTYPVVLGTLGARLGRIFIEAGYLIPLGDDTDQIKVPSRIVLMAGADILFR